MKAPQIYRKNLNKFVKCNKMYLTKKPLNTLNIIKQNKPSFQPHVEKCNISTTLFLDLCQMRLNRATPSANCLILM